MAGRQDVGYPGTVFHGVEQRRADADLLEKSLHAGHVAAQRFHLRAFEQRGALDHDMRIAFGPQPEQGLQRRMLLNAAAFQLADDDAGGPGFPHVQLRKGLRSLGVDRIDGPRLCLRVRGTEMHQQQGCLVAGL